MGKPDDAAAGVMPVAELKPLLALSKRQPVNCAIGLTKDKQAVVLLHRRLRPRKLMTQLRRSSGAGLVLDNVSLRFGHATVDGGSDRSTVHFTINKASPDMLRMKLVERLRPAGFQHCVITVDEALENEAEDDGEEEDGDAVSGQSPPTTVTGLDPPPTAGTAVPGAEAGPSAPDAGSQDAAGQLRARLAGLIRKAVAQGGNGPANPAIKTTALAARDALVVGDLAEAGRATDRLDALVGAFDPPSSAVPPGAAIAGGSAGATLPPASPPPAASPTPAGVPEDASAGEPPRAAPAPVGADAGSAAQDPPALQLVAYTGRPRKSPAPGANNAAPPPSSSPPPSSAPSAPPGHPAQPRYRELTIHVPANCGSIADLERLMDRQAGLDDHTRWDWPAPMPAIEALRNTDLKFDVLLVQVPAPVTDMPAIEVTGYRSPPATMQEATNRVWGDVDDTKIATMPEDQRRSLAGQKANELAAAQLKFMAEYPGATAADFLKSATLANTPEVLAAAGADIHEALHGDTGAYARIAAAAGGTAKISGWLLAVVGVAYVASWLVGVGEVATLAVAAEALLATTMVASSVEAQAHIAAAGQTKDPREFHRQTDAAGAAEATIAMSIAAIIGMKVLEITARIPAVKAALDEVRTGLEDFRQRTVGEPIEQLKPMVRKAMADARVKFAGALESAKALAAKQAAGLRAMTTEQFALQGAGPGGADYAKLVKTPEGRATVEADRTRLAAALERDMPRELDRQFARTADALDAFDKAADAAKDKQQLDAAANDLAEAIGEKQVRSALEDDQKHLIEDAAGREGSGQSQDNGGGPAGNDPPPRTPDGRPIRTFDTFKDFTEAANKPEPNTVYRWGNYTWETDGLGRPIRAQGKVVVKEFGRNDTRLQVSIGKETPGRVDGDIGFHLIGDGFDAPTNRLNVVPGNGVRAGELKNLNQGAYRRFENQVKTAASKPGANVEIRVEPKYNPGNTTGRPDSFDASYRTDGGPWVRQRFRNKPQ